MSETAKVPTILGDFFFSTIKYFKVDASSCSPTYAHNSERTERTDNKLHPAVLSVRRVSRSTIKENIWQIFNGEEPQFIMSNWLSLFVRGWAHPRLWTAEVKGLGTRAIIAFSTKVE